MTKSNTPLPILNIDTDKAFLQTPALDVQEITPDIFELIEQMRITMKKANGIGLAAPQVGKPLRLFIVDMKPQPHVFINPKITWTSSQKESDFEGCLSIPHVFGKVSRHKKIKVKYLDLEGKQQVMTAKGLIARVIQHEYDHIQGVLFISKATDIYRDDKK